MVVDAGLKEPHAARDPRVGHPCSTWFLFKCSIVDVNKSESIMTVNDLNSIADESGSPHFVARGFHSIFTCPENTFHLLSETLQDLFK